MCDLQIGKDSSYLLASRSNVSPSIRQVSQFVKAQGKNLANMTIDEVARGAGVSKSTVIRFCQHQGYSGYRALKQSLISEILVRSQRKSESNIADNEHKLHTRVFTEHIAALNETYDLFDEQVLNEVTERLLRSSLIVWYGIGESGALAQAADYKCMLGGLRSKAIVEHSVLRHMAQQLGPEDTVICISRSGRQGSAYYTLQDVREASGVYIISVTGAMHSPIARMSDTSLITAPRDMFYYEKKISWLTPHLIAIEIIVANILYQRSPDEVRFPW